MNTEKNNSSIMNKTLLSLAMIVVVIGVISNIYLWKKEIEPEKEGKAMQDSQDMNVDGSQELHGKIKEPGIRYPVPDELSLSLDAPVSGGEPDTTQELPVKKQQPLPTLDESDLPFKESLLGIFAPDKLDELFVIQSFIRHFVVTVDNMTGKKLPQRYVFTRQPAGKFMVRKQENDKMVLLDEQNFNRYKPFVAIADIVDTKQIVALYVRYYPLFQKAYQDLGYPGRHFNDRLVEVIQHLLATPDVRGPIKLHQPKVFYTFADPELERLSAGQKILIRIGPENAERVKVKLGELKLNLTTLR